MSRKNISSRLIAVIIFAIFLVAGSSAVRLFEKTNFTIKDKKSLISSNEEREEINLEQIKTKILIPGKIEEPEIKSDVLLKEKETRVVVYDGLTKEELDNKLNNVLHSTLTGTGSSFSNYSLELGVDPYLAVAIVLQETGCYWNCSALVNQCYNVGGMRGGGSYKCWGGSYDGFASLDDGIRSYVYNLYNVYVSRGLTTAETMNPVYAEDRTWASKVNNYIEMIRNS